jgi:NAD(P)-dependent dehydrogenase (short-subunit alcohol dehydrogenase family)
MSTAIITGASSGIGLAIANLYLSRGGRVVATARDEAKLERAFPASERDRVALVAGDITAEPTAQSLVRTARERFGELDVVISNAGIFAAKPFADYTTADLDAFVAVNLRATLYLTQAAVREWRERRSPGSIVVTTAAIALAPQRARPATLPIAVKGGLNAFVRSLALELAAERIRVNAVAPGIIRTPLTTDPDAHVDAQPMGHIGEASDVAEAALYLAGAPFVTGAILPVDGGMSLGHW